MYNDCEINNEKNSFIVFNNVRNVADAEYEVSARSK